MTRIECIYRNVDTKSKMDLQIAKWGNSLAMRIPSALVRQLKLREGDKVHAQIGPDGVLTVRPAKWSRAQFAAELAAARDALPMGTSVIEKMRREARY